MSSLDIPAERRLRHYGKEYDFDHHLNDKIKFDGEGRSARDVYLGKLTDLVELLKSMHGDDVLVATLVPMWFHALCGFEPLDKYLESKRQKGGEVLAGEKYEEVIWSFAYYTVGRLNSSLGNREVYVGRD